MEFLVVEFEDDCGVIINGITGAWTTNQRLQLQAGAYIVTLDPSAGHFTPPQIKLSLKNTAPHDPRTITFTKVTWCSGRGAPHAPADARDPWSLCRWRA